MVKIGFLTRVCMLSRVAPNSQGSIVSLLTSDVIFVWIAALPILIEISLEETKSCTFL